MLDQLKADLFGRAKLVLGTLPTQAQDFHSYLMTTFGQTITFAIYLAGVALLLVAAIRGLKFSVDVLRFVVVPSIAVGFIGSLALPYGFFHIVPVAAIVFSTLLLMKG